MNHCSRLWMYKKTRLLHWGNAALLFLLLCSVQFKQRGGKKKPFEKRLLFKCTFFQNFEEMLLYLPLQRWDVLLFQLKAKPQSLHQTVTKPLMIFHFVLRLHAVKLTHVPFFPNLIPRQTTSNASLRLPYINSNTTLQTAKFPKLLS